MKDKCKINEGRKKCCAGQENHLSADYVNRELRAAFWSDGGWQFRLVEKRENSFDGSVYLGRLAIFLCRFMFILPHSIDRSFDKYFALPERQFQYVGAITSPTFAPARCAKGTD
ncbi:MAG: hypothetical protein WAN12_13905 [Candidatus Acidiferrum sp.]